MAPASLESNSCRCPRFAPVPQGANLGPRQGSNVTAFLLQARGSERSANESVSRGQDENPDAGSMSPHLDKKERLLRNPMEFGDARASEEEEKIRSVQRLNGIVLE